jgi:two-component system cell cycle response regulator
VPIDLKSPWIPRLSNAPSIIERRENILIVHEDTAARHQLLRLMQVDGYEADALELPDSVLATVARDHPDLILIDVMMTGGAGLELCGELRMLEPTRDVPIILVSEKMEGEELVARGLLAGADDYGAFGERSIELRARVRVQLRNKRYRDALQRVRGEREALRRQAAVDALTGLLNRRSLGDVISEKVIAGEPFVALFIDIDRFKSINDRFGHSVGDGVLKAVADCLKRGMRPGDYCGRYGGEEFVMISPEFSSEQGYRMAERHRMTVAAMPPGDLGIDHPVTVSIGVAVCDTECGETSEDILERADTALYAAKTTGRNRVVVAEAQVSSRRPSQIYLPSGGETPLLRGRGR